MFTNSELFEAAKEERLALKWLKNKFKSKYTFKYNQGLKDIDKRFAVSMNNQEFEIGCKKYDTNGDDTMDTIVFKIIQNENEDF